MRSGFIIIQIGDKELDTLCVNAIVPAMENAGLDAKRVDKHNEGQLLKSEIVRFIQEADIIVADLTNERPNCYLEIGYAMGLDKFKNLILTARKDHLPGSSDYEAGGSKVHFDLSGYDILLWDPKKIDEFQEKLEKKIRARLSILSPHGEKIGVKFDEEWIKSGKEHGSRHLSSKGLKGSMEITFHLEDHVLNVKQKDLLNAARDATIRTFGWPIGIVLDNLEGARPTPSQDGIVTEVDIEDSYDYWKLRKNGDYYLIKSIFEDKRKKDDKLFFNTRIVRVTETLLYCARLYSRLGVPNDKKIRIRIKHSGLSGRELTAVGGREWSMWEGNKATEDESGHEIIIPLSEIESRLSELVGEFVNPMFALFNFWELEKRILEEIVDKFTQGQTS